MGSDCWALGSSARIHGGRIKTTEPERRSPATCETESSDFPPPELFQLFTEGNENLIRDRLTSVSSPANTNKDAKWLRISNQRDLDGIKDYVRDHKEDVQEALQDTLEQGFPTTEDEKRDFVMRQTTLGNEQAKYQSCMLKNHVATGKLVLTLCRSKAMPCRIGVL